MQRVAVNTAPGLVGNTHIITQSFDLYQPGSLDDALAWLSQHGADARVLAGGTDILVQMKLERQQASEILWLGGVAEMKHRVHNGGLSLGALVSIYEIQNDAFIRETYTALHEAARSFTGTQIKVMATIGGNLCNASPAADSAPALLVHDADLTLARADQPVTRRVPLTEFFLGPGKTVRQPDELLTEIHLPEPEPYCGCAFLKVGRVGADIAKVNVAVRLVRDGARVADCRIALGSVAPTPLRARRAEAHLIDSRLDDTAVFEAAQLAVEAIAPITDLRSTAQYRLQVANVLVRDALHAAWSRARRGER